MNNKFFTIFLIIISILFINSINAKYKNTSKILLRCKNKCFNKKSNSRFCKICADLETENENKNSKEKGSPLLLLSNSNIFHYNEIRNLIVFGDSHSSVGTNYTDMTYTGKNHSGGKNWPLYLIELNNMKLWNYATPGSVIDKKFLEYEESHGDRNDVINQYKYFYENMSKGKKYYNVWNGKNSLIVIWIGSVDIHYVLPENIENITTQLFNIINKMYEVGARNILIFDALPHDKNPYCVKGKCDHLKNGYLTLKNNILRKSKKLFREHSDINLIFYNTVEFFEEILLNCNKYKFKDCIHAWKNDKKNSLNDYFWFDSHITDLANKYLAMDINYILNSINNIH